MRRGLLAGIALVAACFGYAALFAVAAQPTPVPSSSAMVTARGGDTARRLADISADHLNAQAFGHCTWDATHDVGPCIAAAIAYAMTLPTGATINLPRGKFNNATQLAISKPTISLVGDGRGGILRHDAAPNILSYSTQLVWTGAAGATMLNVSPIADGVSGQRNGGNDITGIMFNCNGIAATCMRFASSTFSHVDVGFAEPNGGAGVLIDTTTLAETNNPDLNTISVHGIVINSATPGVVLDGTGAGSGNTSIMRMPLVRVIHKDGDCMQIRRADHVMTYMLACGRRPGGVGNTLVLYGNDTFGGAYSNWFGYVGGAGPIIAKGTTSYVNPSTNNVIDFLDKTNNTPDPTLETGASMQWRRDDGVMVGFGAYQQDFSSSATTMTRLRTLTQQDPVRIFANNNTGLMLGANSGATNIVGRFYIDPNDFLMHFQNVGSLAGIQFGSTLPVFITGGLSLTNLPTSCSGKTAGTIFNNGGAINVCP